MYSLYTSGKILVGFTLQAKLVSSKHLIQVHLKISSRTFENLASHLVTKYTLEAQAVNHLSPLKSEMRLLAGKSWSLCNGETFYVVYSLFCL